MDPKLPLVSVIIPIYNVENYLDQCISSVCGQLYRNLQIILVDDGSTDNGLAICEKYKEQDDRVVLIHKTNGGLVSARKAGVRAADGEYISFVDGDDWIDANAFEQIADCFSAAVQTDIIAYGCIEEYSDFTVHRCNAAEEGVYTGKRLETLKQTVLMGDTFFDWNILPHLCDKVIKRTLLSECIKHVPNDISFGEDAVTSFLCMKGAGSVWIKNMTPYHYRQREGSIVKGEKELKPDNFRNIYRTLIHSIRGNAEQEKQLKLYMFFILCLKAYSGIGSPMPLFPFTKVKQDSRIFVYGAGGFGKVIADYVLKSSHFKLVGWSDKNADYYIKKGYKLVAVEQILNDNYDYLVIAILNEKIACHIKNDLIRQGIPEEKIDYVGKDILEKQELPEWL